MNVAQEPNWTVANQRLLGAEFARLRARLGGAHDEAAASVETLRDLMPAPAGIDTLAALFDLSAFERDVLLLAAGVEMDARVAALCGEADGRSERTFATFGLALAVLREPHWSALAPTAPLRRFRLVQLDETAGVTAARLHIEERVLHFIAGLNYLDHRLQPLLQSVPAAGLMSAAHRAAVEQLGERLRRCRGRLSAVVLGGDDDTGQRDVAAALAERLGVSLHRLCAADVPATAHEQAALAALWQREAALLGSGLLVTADDDGLPAPAARFVARIDGLVIVAGRGLPALAVPAERMTIDRPDAPGQRTLWHEALGPRAARLTSVVDALSGQYRLGAHRIAELSAEVDGAADAGSFLHRACRADGPAMVDLAQPIEPRARWEDLVLPEPQRRVLGQIAVHVRHRLTVHHDWGFAARSARGLGIATLFWGDSGTGKTLAAEVLASTLGLSLYRIDLSAVVSKYIGETEKNLRRVFDAAEGLGAMLLFDEADALFGKRSEVKDSHDRYANIEVSYLLQRMEAYRGLAILTTNHKAALDAAFARRLRFVVHFPFPDAGQREAIWRATFPEQTPTAGVDCAVLARLAVPGGTIRNIALSAAFLAAEDGRPVTMAHLRRAAHLEAAKRDKPFSDAETRGWV